MARLPKGVLEGYIGKLGNTVGFTRNGKYFVRSMPVKRKDNPTAKQLELRAKFAVVGNFTRVMSPVLNATRNKAKISRTNRPFAYNYNNALTGNYPDFRIDYPNVRLSYGNLSPVNAYVVPVGLGKIRFRWNDMDFSSPGSDSAILICYCPELNDVIYALGSATRHDATALLNVHAFKGKVVHTWITFTSGSRVATSRYCGSVYLPVGKPGRSSTIPMFERHDFSSLIKS